MALIFITIIGSAWEGLHRLSRTWQRLHHRPRFWRLFFFERRLYCTGRDYLSSCHLREPHIFPRHLYSSTYSLGQRSYVLLHWETRAARWEHQGCISAGWNSLFSTGFLFAPFCFFFFLSVTVELLHIPSSVRSWFLLLSFFKTIFF